MFGAEETIEYGDMSSDGKTYEKERVLVLGNGNSANEVAGSLFPWAHSTDLLGRRPMRFAINTHYVGDVRTINSLAAENYVLKLSETFNEIDLDNLVILKLPSGRKLVVLQSEAAATAADNDRPVDQQLFLVLKWLGEDTESDTAVR
jgi:thioredoxin reductase